MRRPVTATATKPKQRAISLFSGAGGDTLGMERAGYEVIAFSEMNLHATKTHRTAFPHSLHLTEEKTNSSDIQTIPDHVWRSYRGTVQVVFAGFPCQGFSQAGKKRQEDPRNELVYEFARVVDHTRPEWFIGENVTGLLRSRGKDPVTGEQRPVIDIIQDIFERIGYHITYRIWRASDHGVPQERKRLILIGAPKEKGYPSLPPLLSSTPCPTLRSFLESHLEGAVPFPKENLPIDLSPHFWIPTTETEPAGTPHPNLLRLVQGIRGLTRKEKEEEDRKGQKTTIHPGGLISFGVRKSAYHGQILDPDLPSKTIICTYHSCPRLFVGLHHQETDTYWVRCLTVTELGQIQGFPKDYPWQGKEKDKVTQIGNAVPPPLAEAILRSLPSIPFSKTPVKQEQKEEKDQEQDEEEQEQE
jgi:DNA (cytosine-5)-methyltransferase 1